MIVSVFVRPYERLEVCKINPKQRQALEWIAQHAWVAMWWRGSPLLGWPKQMPKKTFYNLLSKRYVHLKMASPVSRIVEITPAGVDRICRQQEKIMELDHLKELAGVVRGLEAQGENTDAAYVKWAAAEILRLRDSLTHISSLNGQPTAQDIARMTLSSGVDHA